MKKSINQSAWEGGTRELGEKQDMEGVLRIQVRKVHQGRMITLVKTYDGSVEMSSENWPLHLVTWSSLVNYNVHSDSVHCFLYITVFLSKWKLLHPKFLSLTSETSFFLFSLYLFLHNCGLSGIWENTGFLLSLLLNSLYFCYMHFLHVLFNTHNFLDLIFPQFT